MEIKSESFFEKKIKETAGGEDPLAAYISFHSWLKTNKKTKKKQSVIVSRAIQKFRNDPRYKQDNRFVRLCTLYAQLLSNPIEYFDYLSRKGIGTEWALFYEAKALFQEKQSLFQDAMDTYREGIRCQAKPIARLRSNYEEFKKRKSIKEECPSDDPPAHTEPTMAENTSKNQSSNEEFQVEELRARVYLKQREQQERKRIEEETKQKEALRKLEAEKQDKLRLEEEKLKKEREELENQRILQEKAKQLKEKKRMERERKEREAAERREQERKEAEKQEQERIAREELERKQREHQEAEQKRIERQRKEIEQAKREREELEKKRLERARKEREEAALREKERQEAEKKRIAREEAEQREKELQEAKKREEEEQEKLKQQTEHEKLVMNTTTQSNNRVIDLSALEVDMSDPENEISSDTEGEEVLTDISFEETGDKTVVLDMLPDIGDDLITRSGSSMFNILDRTSNLNSTIHNTTGIFREQTVTIFTKKAQDIIKDSFCGALSDEENEESEDSEESEESEDTHIHGFTGHITTPMVDDPLAPFEICQDNSEPFDLDSFIKPSGNQSSGLTVFSDENQLSASTPFDDSHVLGELPIPSNTESPFEVLTVEVDALSSDDEEHDTSENNDFVIYSDPKQEQILSSHSPLNEFQFNEPDGDKENKNEFHVYSSPPRTNELPLQQSKSNPPSSPFVLFQDENSRDDIFALGESEDSSMFAVYKSPQSVPRSPFSVFQDNSTANEQDTDPFQIDLSADTRSEDIFELSDIDDLCDSDDNTSDIFQEDDIVLFSDSELANTLHPSGTLNPYTHQHASELQALPLFQSFLQQQKSKEIYAKWDEKAPRSTKLQQAPKRMRSTKFKEEDFEEFPLFVGDRRSITNSSVLSLGPCVGSGGFAKVFLVHHFLELEGDNDTMFVEETKRALKFQKHSEDPWAIRWEFYLMSMVHSRLSGVLSKQSNMYNAQYMAKRFCSAMYLREFDDASFLMLSYLDQGTLFDLINAHRMKNRKIDEVLTAFLSLEVLSILYVLHSCNIIHGDIKPDNFLFMNQNAQGEWKEWSVSGDPSWHFRGLQLIDFGRGIDLSLYEAKENQKFIGDNHVKELQCIEMREGDPWSYQVDLFGACAIIHLLLCLKPLEVTKKRPSRECASLPGIEGEYYLPKEIFKRRTFNWELLFLDLLYVENSDCLSLLKKHICALQEFVAVHSKKIRVALSKEHQLMHEQGF